MQSLQFLVRVFRSLIKLVSAGLKLAEARHKRLRNAGFINPAFSFFRFITHMGDDGSGQCKDTLYPGPAKIQNKWQEVRIFV